MMTAAVMTQKSDQSTIYGSSSSAGGSVGNSWQMERRCRDASGDGKQKHSHSNIGNNFVLKHYVKVALNGWRANRCYQS